MSRPEPSTPHPAQALNAVARLVGDLFGPDWLGDPGQVLAGDVVPESCRNLLVHTDHMTQVLERHFGEPMKLQMLVERRDSETYRRAIVLTYGNDDRVAEFGAVRIQLDAFAPEVRDEILHRRLPLGEILIRHDVLRRVEPRAYLRFSGHCPILLYFRKPGLTEAYGRWGTLHANGAPAIELLEIVAAREES